ncbi:MAG: FAD-binding protein [Bdellovibrionales bacterium]
MKQSFPYFDLYFCLMVSPLVQATAPQCQDVLKPRKEPVQSFNHETVHQNALVFSPTTLQELQDVIRTVANRGQKVRLAGASHSITSIIRSDGVYVRTLNLNRIKGLGTTPSGEHFVTVESGVKLGDLYEYLAARGLTLGFAFPYYQGLTIGGLLSTGSHGSSRVHPALSSQRILSMTLVNGRGETVVIDERSPDLFKAAKVGLGLLGAVYEIKLRVVPHFNLEMVTTTLEGDQALLARRGEVNWGPVADAESIAWFPYEDRAIKFSGSMTKSPAQPGAENIILGDSSEMTLQDHLIKKALFLGKSWPYVNRKAEDKRFKAMRPYVYRENGQDIPGMRVVGPAHKMLLSRKIDPNPLYTFQDLSFSFPESKAYEVLYTIREFSRQNEFYFPVVGVFMRFARSTGETFMSHIDQPGRAGELYILAEFAEPKEYGPDGKDESSTSAQLRTQLLRLLAEKHQVGFHWGKNVDQNFRTSNLRSYYGENLDRFYQQVRAMDPEGVFSTETFESWLRP